MQTRKIVRVVDALATQGRMIVWLDCHHKPSIAQMHLHAEVRDFLTGLKPGAPFECPFCPDLQPEELRQAKTARQLWKDAGEP